VKVISSRPSGTAAQDPGAWASFEIFPWSREFETGIALIDEQHRTLLGLLNALARNLAGHSDGPPASEVLRELTAYATYHFDTEESLMRQYLAGDSIESSHREAHRAFFTDIAGFKAQAAAYPGGRGIEEIVAYLTRWLVQHIMDVDRRTALVILALQAGDPLERAKEAAGEETPGSVRVLMQAVLRVYEEMSSRTFQLMKEIADRERAEARLRLAGVAFDNTLEAIFVTDALGQVIDVNTAYCDIRGLARGEIIGRDMRDMQPWLQDVTLLPVIWNAAALYGHWSGQVQSRSAADEPVLEWLTLSAVKDAVGEVINYVGVFSNITQLIDRQNKLERMAHHDALTGLPNRRFLLERLAQAVAQARRSNTYLAVCFLDLDGFKAVNDELGHAAGDQLLQAVAERFRATLRRNDTVARLGGDEFAILLGELDRPEECIALLERILAEVHRPVALAAGTVSVTASIGVTIFPEDDEEPAGLLDHADLAMYLAKNEGKSRYRMFDEQCERRFNAHRARIAAGVVAPE